MEDTDRKLKRKKTRYFETHISKILKSISSGMGITSNAKQQLNSALQKITAKLSETARELTVISGKRTLSEKEVENAVRIITTPEMASDATSKASEALSRYSVDEKRYNSRQEKAGILIPPATVEKFLRDFGCSKLMVTKQSPVYLACIVEHIARTLITPAKDITVSEGRMRVAIRELELSVSTSENLRILFKNCCLSFIGGGVVPEIHESLLNKKPRKRKKGDEPPKRATRRFRPGTVSLREIKKMQRTSNCLVFAKLPFERFVRRLLEDEAQGVKVSKEVFIILQHYIEQYLVGFLRDANRAAIHSGRVKLIPSDIRFISTLRDGRPGELFSDRLSSGTESNDI